MNLKKIVIIASVILLIISCSFTKYDESDGVIINAKTAIKKIAAGYTFVDAGKATSYGKGHIIGALNIERNSINIKEPVPNSVAPASVISEVAGSIGLTTETNIIIYDDNKNMDSSRLFWTLKNYGHTGDILIVAGGLTELKDAGLEVSKKVELVKITKYKTTRFNKDSITTTNTVESMIDNPDDNFKLIDVRSDDEFSAGTIPGSIHINHEDNLFNDFSFRSVQQIRILYKENGIMPDDNIVMFCKSSIRATNSYVALYNAGYRNLKIYDGAWLQWTKDKMPVYVPETEVAVTITQQDNS
ncbi:MAG: rhodanese-like domain-containing protein [Spirochaetaceae bacterium]